MHLRRDRITIAAQPVASWFETRGVAALLTMRISDLILRRPQRGRLEG
jgi:hypothetical protein